MDNFIVTSDGYPGISAMVSDLILPTAMIYEKWGAYGNAERRTQHWKQQVLPVGDAMSDTWLYVELSKRFKVKDVWCEYTLRNKVKLPNVIEEAKKMGYTEDTTLYEILFANERAKAYKQTIQSAKVTITLKYSVIVVTLLDLTVKYLKVTVSLSKNIYLKNMLTLDADMHTTLQTSILTIEYVV